MNRPEINIDMLSLGSPQIICGNRIAGSLSSHSVVITPDNAISIVGGHSVAYTGLNGIIGGFTGSVASFGLLEQGAEFMIYKRKSFIIPQRGFYKLNKNFELCDISYSEIADKFRDIFNDLRRAYVADVHRSILVEKEKEAFFMLSYFEQGCED